MSTKDDSKSFQINEWQTSRYFVPKAKTFLEKLSISDDTRDKGKYSIRPTGYFLKQLSEL